MKNKRGFTLVEIIICISLIVIIGVSATVVVLKTNKTREINILKANEKKLENALQVYVSNHKEITTNLNNNAKAALVTLETLKNEGLIKDDMKVDYKENYFMLSNAVLAPAGKYDCENNVIGIEVFKKWDLKELDGSKVIYICPRDDGVSSNNAITNKEDYVAKGENPKNFVKLNERLWRIVEITNGNVFLIANDKESVIKLTPKELVSKSCTSNDWSVLGECTNMSINDSKLNIKYVTGIDVFKAGDTYFDYNNNWHTYINEYSNYPEKFRQKVFETYMPDKSSYTRYQTYETNIGLIDVETLKNANSNDGNYIIDLLSKYTKNDDEYILSVGTYALFQYIASAEEGNDDLLFVNPHNVDRRFKYSVCKDVKLYIVPIIKLKNCYNFTNSEGTKDEPYELINNCS